MWDEGFWVKVLGFRVWGKGFRVKGFRVQGLGLVVEDLGFKV